LSYNICEDASGFFKTEDEEVQTQIREDSSAVHTHTHTERHAFISALVL